MEPLSIHISVNTKAEFNLAYEEYLIHHSKDDVLLFYLNEDAVILGKHQNIWKEVNIDYCNQNKIKIRRRLSGGGTVFHDINNLNFSFIRNKDTDFVNFREHIEPISNALKSAGIDNSITSRNDIFIGDHKISGNAEHVNNTKKRILHHGTLLVASDLTKLRAAIQPLDLSIDTHAVSSVRSKVTTIGDHSSFKTGLELLDYLKVNLSEHIKIREHKTIDPAELDEVCSLVSNKYTQWDWNFAHSPQFKYSIATGDEITVRKGLIQSVKGNNLPAELKAKLVGLTIHPLSLKKEIDVKYHTFIDQICLPS